MRSNKKETIISPFTGGAVHEEHGTEKMSYMGEEFEVPVCFYVCEDTQEQFTTTEQDQAWFNELKRLYSQRHK